MLAFGEGKRAPGPFRRQGHRGAESRRRFGRQLSAKNHANALVVSTMRRRAYSPRDSRPFGCSPVTEWGPGPTIRKPWIWLAQAMKEADPQAADEGTTRNSGWQDSVAAHGQGLTDIKRRCVPRDGKGEHHWWPDGQSPTPAGNARGYSGTPHRFDCFPSGDDLSAASGWDGRDLDGGARFCGSSAQGTESTSLIKNQRAKHSRGSDGTRSPSPISVEANSLDGFDGSARLGGGRLDRAGRGRLSEQRKPGSWIRPMLLEIKGDDPAGG